MKKKDKIFFGLAFVTTLALNLKVFGCKGLWVIPLWGIAFFLGQYGLPVRRQIGK